MLRGVDLHGFYYEDNPFAGTLINTSNQNQNQNQNHTQHNTANSGLEEVYATDEFRMYAYKIKNCPRTRSHDWTECPYAHRGEKAARRDPRKVPYSAIACPLFRDGKCFKGDACDFAHGVFEYWLHPSRYRTRVCNAGVFCTRKVCFFAHKQEELRPEKKYICPMLCSKKCCLGRLIGGGEEGSVGGPADMAYPDAFATQSCLVESSTKSSSSLSMPVFGSPIRFDGGSYFDGVSEFLDRLRSMKINGNNNNPNDEENYGELPRGNIGIANESESELPRVEWISDLLK